MIINIGFNRAGTTSLDGALQILGFKSIHNTYDKDIKIFWDNIKSNRKLLDNMDYDAFLDHPFLQMGILSVLIEQYPNAHFIYTKRNHTDRYKSEKLPYSEKSWVVWEKHKEEIIDYILEQNKHLKVLHFNICDNGDGWNKLCGFLNMEVPNVEFPHLNIGSFGNSHIN
jgi:hypothetical protein